MSLEPSSAGASRVGLTMTSSAVPSPPVPRRRRLARRRLWALAFLLPALAPFLLVMIVPSVEGAVYAFTNWTGIGNAKHFTGLANFKELFEDPEAVSALWHTLALAFVVTVFENVLGLGLALGLNTRIKTRGILRVVFFFPVLVTPVIVANLWGFIFQLNGPLNAVLKGVGLGSLTEVWIGDQSTALWAICGTIIWQFAGYAMVIYLAGLQTVPEELLEAARLDGAGAWRTLISIKLPLLKPAVTVALVMSTLAGLKVFDQVWVLTQGGPGTSTQTMSTFMYLNAFVLGRYGFATAEALLLTVITMVFALIQVRALNLRSD